MYIQGLQQLFKDASNAVMVMEGFSESVGEIVGRDRLINSQSKTTALN